MQTVVTGAHFYNVKGIKKQCKLLYHTKDNDDDYSIYLDIKEVFEQYTTDEFLSQIYHCWDTNVNKSFHKFVTKFLRKDSYISETISAKSRIYVAAAIFNDGYVNYYSKFFEWYGMTYFGTSIFQHHQHLDLMREYHHKYKRRHDVKRRKAILKTITLKEEIKKSFSTGRMGRNIKKTLSVQKMPPNKKRQKKKKK